MSFAELFRNGLAQTEHSRLVRSGKFFEFQNEGSLILLDFTDSDLEAYANSLDGESIPGLEDEKDEDLPAVVTQYLLIWFREVINTPLGQSVGRVTIQQDDMGYFYFTSDKSEPLPLTFPEIDPGTNLAWYAENPSRQ